MKQKLKVLSVDDNTQGNRLETEYAEGKSIVAKGVTYVLTFFMASNIDEAMESIEENNPDLIVSDMDMGDENGFQFWDRIKSTFKGIFFFYTGSAREHYPKAKELGVSIYQKDNPIMFDAIKEELNK